MGKTGNTLIEVCKNSDKGRNDFSSVHRFIWPFYIKKGFDPSEFGWSKSSFSKENREWYATSQYLSNNAKKIFESSKDNICNIYTKKSDKQFYVIDKSETIYVGGSRIDLYKRFGLKPFEMNIHLYKKDNNKGTEITGWNYRLENENDYYIFDDECLIWIVDANNTTRFEKSKVFDKDKKTKLELFKQIYEAYIKFEISGPVVLKKDENSNILMSDIENKQHSTTISIDTDLGLTMGNCLVINPLVLKFRVSEIENNSKIQIITDTSFRLPLCDYEMHIYGNKVGFLLINCINLKFFNNNEVDRLKKINDYGRRVEIPYFPYSGTGINADKLGILTLDTSNQTDYGTTDFKKYIDKYNGVYKNEKEKNENISENKKLERPDKPSDFLLKIIFNGKDIADKHLDVNKNTEERMFAMTLVNIPSLCEEVTKLGTNDFDNAVKKLYPVVFNDSGDATCQNTEMRNEIFREAGNYRWTDYGTLHSVTQYSFTCITSFREAFETVALPFINIYTYLYSVVMAQRYTLLYFSDKYTDIIIKKDSIGTLIQDYAVFKNELLLSELSTQEQGIEIYRKMRKQMLVDSELEELESQMAYLNESVAYKFNKKMNFLSYYGVLLAIIIYFKDAITAKLDSLFKDTMICKVACSVRKCLSFENNFNFYLGIIILIYLVVRIFYILFTGKLNYYYKRVCEYTRDNIKQIVALVFALFIAFILLYFLLKAFGAFRYESCTALCCKIKI